MSSENARQKAVNTTVMLSVETSFILLFCYFWIEDNVRMQTTMEVVEPTVLTRIHFSIDLRQNSVNAPG